MTSNIPHASSRSVVTPSEPPSLIPKWGKVAKCIPPIACNALSYLEEEEPTPLLPIAEITDRSSSEFRQALSQLPLRVQIRVLGLDTWQTSGNKMEACSRIIQCFLNNRTEISLANLKLTTLPSFIGNLVNLQELVLYHNELTVLPDSIGNLVNLKELFLHMNALTVLPGSIGNLVNLKELHLSANQLTSLPNSIGNLVNLKRLELRGRGQCTALPDSIGNLVNLQYLDLGFNQLTGLPISVLQLPADLTINLTDAGLSNEVLARLQEQTQQPHYSGPSFSVSAQENHSADEKPYEELVSRLYEIIGQAVPDELQKLAQDPGQKEALQSWLNRLSWTADGQKNERRKVLYKAITEILEYAANNEEYRHFFQALLIDASATCGDRVGLSILKLDVAKQLAVFDKHNLTGLANLLKRGGFALDIMEEIARNKIASQTLKFFDEIEVYLAYPIRLKEIFNLPIHTDSMLYFRCSGLTDEDIKQAEELVRARLEDPAQVVDYLVSNDIWRKALEVNYPERYQAIMDAANVDGIDPTEDLKALTLSKIF